MDKKMEKAHILRRMDLSQRATGSIIKDMGERYNNIKMEINLSGNIKMGWRMVMELIIIWMGQIMRETLRMGIMRVKGGWSIKMDHNIMGNGLKIFLMVKVYMYSRIMENIKVNSKMVGKMEREYLFFKMEINILENLGTMR